MKRLFARRQAVALEEIAEDVQSGIAGGLSYCTLPDFDSPDPFPQPDPWPIPVPTFGINENPMPSPVPTFGINEG